MLSKRFLLIICLLVLLAAFAVPAYADEEYSSGNPPPKKDNFSQWPAFGEGEDWRYYILDGNSGSVSVNSATTFDNSTVEITPSKELHFFQVYDSDFDDEYPYQYNNVFMIGFQGYLPNTQRDIVWSFDMQIEPGFYGTTGFVVERKNTFAADGTFALPFDFFGVSYTGPENFNAGLQCTYVLNWIPLWGAPISGIDPLQWNNYEIRFHYIDSENVLATISINETQVCQTTISNFGETEIQVWLDNYKVSLDPLNPQNVIIGFNNQATPQGVLFDNIAAKATPTP